MAISMASLFGTIIVLPIYLQQVLHLDPLATGLLLLPGGLIMGLLAPFVGRLYDRFGPRVLVVPGSILVSAVMWTLTMVTENTVAVHALAAHVVLSIGLALMFTPLFTAGLGAVTPHLYSHGSALARHDAAGRRRGGNGALRRDHVGCRRPPCAAGGAGRRGSGRAASRGVPRRRDHLGVRRGRVVLHPQARRRACGSAFAH